MNQKKKKLLITILGGIILYLTSAGLSYGAFHYLAGPGRGILAPVPVEEARSKIDLSAPKTEACPLNGQLFTKAERQVWENRRPLAVMIENHEDSRPQSGLSSADVVYEAIAEGGITRFLAVFYCGASAEDVEVAPVRSSRIYFINLASEYGDKPIYLHVGGANDYGGTGETVKEARALEYLAQIGWRVRGGNDFDTTFDGRFPVFWRNEDRLDHPVAVEHTMMSSTDRAWEEAKTRGLDAVDDEGKKWEEDFSPWKFKDEVSVDKRGQITSIGFDFWDDYKEYEVRWEYDSQSNRYLRYNGGQPQMDLNDNQEITAKNVVVQFTKERGPIDQNKHMLYEVIGTGQALIFQDGQVTKGTWAKKDRVSRTIFKNSKGQEVEFNPGPVWIEILPVGQKVEY